MLGAPNIIIRRRPYRAVARRNNILGLTANPPELCPAGEELNLAVSPNMSR